jgi:hypothetical protein
VPEWADACAVELAGDAGPEAVAAAGPPPAALGGTAGGDGGAADVLRVPLAAGGGAAPLGCLTAARGPGRPPFDADDRALAAELARRAALAVENARLFHAAQEAVAARERVLAVVAHDLRSPLTAVRFDVEMLRAEPAAPLAEGDARTLARVERAAARMDALIEDLLDATRIGRDALASTAARTTWARSSPRRPSSLRRSSRAGAPLHGRPAGGRSPLVVSTRGACCRRSPTSWATPPSSPRTAAASRSPGARPATRSRWPWRRRPGIPPDALSTSSAPSGRRATPTGAGSGSGSRSPRGIAEAHGGRLWVESVVGAGATFVLALPLAGGG